MGSTRNAELGARAPHHLLESALPDSEDGESLPVPPKTHRGRLVVVAAFLVGGVVLVLFGRKYPWQSPTDAKDAKDSTIDASFPDDIMQKSACQDLTGWEDSYGDKCDWYKSQSECGQAPAFKDNDGVDATQACCSCGGGCADDLSWVDSHGDKCDWYHNEHLCALAQKYVNSAGKDASQACCRCGGRGGAGGGGGGGGGSANCGLKGSSSRRLGAANGSAGGLSGKIVNGRNADTCEWPWQILLEFKFLCGGMLIHPEWVLTAAHCLDEGYDNLKLVAGLHRRGSEGSNVQRRAYKKVIIHPQWKNPNQNSNDLALVQLASPMHMTDCVGTICLPEHDVAEGTQCWITGFGTIHEGGPAARVLQEAEVDIHPQQDCHRKNHGRIEDNMICAQGRNAQGKITDGCQGDSGGPLVCESQGRWTLYGATSWGFGCADESKPGVWARVHHASDWIESTMR